MNIVFKSLILVAFLIPDTANAQHGKYKFNKEKFRKDAPGSVFVGSSALVGAHIALPKAKLATNVDMIALPFSSKIRQSSIKLIKSKPAGKVFWGIALVSGAAMLYDRYGSNDEPERSQIMNRSLSDEIGRLHEQKEQGILSPQQFEQAKEKIFKHP